MKTINLLFTLTVLCSLSFSAKGQTNLLEQSDTCSSGYIFNNSTCVEAKEIQYSDAGFTIDGDASEWGNIGVFYNPEITYGKPNNPDNPKDYSVSLKLSWDDDALYFLIDAVDDLLQLTDEVYGNNFPFGKDGLEFATFLTGPDSSRYPGWSGYPPDQWGITDDGNGPPPSWNYHAPAWAAKHYLIPGLDAVEQREAGHNYFEWDTVNNELNTNFDLRDFTGFHVEYKDKASGDGYFIEASMSWDFLNGYNNPDLDYDTRFIPQDGATFCYWLQFNDVDGSERNKVGTTPGDWVQINPANNNIILVKPTGITRLNDLHVTLHPNPAKDFLYIRNYSSVKNIEIINLTGNVIKSLDNINNNSISISELPDGIYFLRATISNGNTGIAKFIKQ